MDLLDTVRLLAMGNMVPTDAGMACFDSKYTYRFWRPITAIRNADLDRNPATTADPGWSPLTATPNHPEYPSQHGCVTSALAQVLAHAVGSNEINATIWGATAASPTGLVTSRTYTTVNALMDELVNARVWIGFHFRSSVVVGENLGHIRCGLGASALLPADERRLIGYSGQRSREVVEASEGTRSTPRLASSNTNRRGPHDGCARRSSLISRRRCRASAEGTHQTGCACSTSVDG